MIPGNSNFCRFCGAAQHGQESTVYHAAGPQLPVHTQVDTAQYTEDQPATKTIERRHLAPRVKISFMIGYLGKTSILAIMILVGVFLQPIFFGVAAAIYVLMVVIVTELVYNHFYYEINETHFRKEFGIFHKKNVTIPFEQIQNVNIRRSLIDQLLGLARIDLETAGSSAVSQRSVGGGSYSLAEGHLPGLTLKDAKEIHDLMLQKVTASR
jgi:uncharacterized membrane protein YdbT with pleckstrin-like domain